MNKSEQDLSQIKELAEMRIDIKYIKEAIKEMVSVKDDVESLKKWRIQVTSILRFLAWLIGVGIVVIPVAGYILTHVKLY